MQVIARKAARKTVILKFFCCNSLDENLFPVHLPGESGKYRQSLALARARGLSWVRALFRGEGAIFDSLAYLL